MYQTLLGVTIVFTTLDRSNNLAELLAEAEAERFHSPPEMYYTGEFRF